MGGMGETRERSRMLTPNGHALSGLTERPEAVVAIYDTLSTLD